MASPSILGRVAVRTGLALWRHRVQVLALGLVVGGLGATMASAAVPPPVGDCADVTMRAVSVRTPEAARMAYGCLDRGFASRVNQEQFVGMIRNRESQGAEQAMRVAEHRVPNGGRIVFYVMNSPSASVGYVVYLDNDGKVTRIE